MSELLRFSGVDIGTDEPIVKNLSITLQRGERLGLVGESGSGKTLSALSIAGLLPGSVRITAGSVTINLPEKTIAFPDADANDITQLRRSALGFVFQEPMSALNPVKTCGWQLMESISLTEKTDKSIRKQKALEWLQEVELPEPERAFSAYPHELSGGQRQRLMIAMALCNKPTLLIADEPTTALDVRVRDVVLDLIERLCARYQTALLLISHDLKMVARRCDYIAVLKQGVLCEYGKAEDVVKSPVHPYTKALWACRPNPELRVIPLPSVDEIENNTSVSRKTYSNAEWHNLGKHLREKQPMLRCENLRFSYGQTPILKGVNFNLYPGESLGILGESGCGKSTLSRVLCSLEPLQHGNIFIRDGDVEYAYKNTNRRWRAERIQMIFQDAMAALNPHHTVGAALTEVRKHFFPSETKHERASVILSTLSDMGLSTSSMQRYPHAFSGGQRQRICIARALLAEPSIIICDESVAALDVSVQAQILNVLAHIRDEKGVSFIFISHDPDTVRYFCHRVLVMEKGQFIEPNQTPHEST